VGPKPEQGTTTRRRRRQSPPRREPLSYCHVSPPATLNSSISYRTHDTRHTTHDTHTHNTTRHHTRKGVHGRGVHGRGVHGRGSAFAEVW
jgi:hypothetical protein